MEAGTWVPRGSSPTNTGCRYHHKGNGSATEEQERVRSGNAGCQVALPAALPVLAGATLLDPFSGSMPVEVSCGDAPLLRPCVSEQVFLSFCSVFLFCHHVCFLAFNFTITVSFPLTFKVFTSSLPSHYRDSLALMLLSP